MENTNRIYAFDNAKAIASIMGVFYHVSLIFTSSWVLHIKPENYHEGLTYFIQYFNVGRMPVFLFIAGFFACYNIQKYSNIKYLFRRVQRILLPFIFASLIIIPFQAYWEAKYNIMNSEFFSFTDFLHFYINKPFNFSHLWFLYYIFIFSGLLLIAKWLIPKKIKILFNGLFSKIHHNVFLTIPTWAFIIYAFHFAGKYIAAFLSVKSIWFDIEDIALRLPVFIMGCLALLHKDIFINYIIRQNTKTILIICLLYATTVIVHAGFLVPADWFIFQVIKITQLFLILSVFFRLLNYTNPLLKYMANASYPFYILHHPVIIFLGYFYLNYFNHGKFISDFILLCLISILLTYLLYHILVKSNSLGKFLFTGFFQRQINLEDQVKAIAIKWAQLIPIFRERKPVKVDC